MFASSDCADILFRLDARPHFVRSHRAKVYSKTGKAAIVDKVKFYNESTKQLIRRFPFDSAWNAKPKRYEIVKSWVETSFEQSGNGFVQVVTVCHSVKLEK